MSPDPDERFDSARTLFELAQRYLPGGVCASARQNVALGHPFYVTRGDGPYIYDLEGREYIDLCMSHGASLLGHNHPRIKAAVTQALDLGIICSSETPYHTALAQRICELVPCAEMVRFAGSGTESIMHALRLARTVTGREKVIKFEGHFHGYSDDLYFSSAPPLDQGEGLPYPQSAGIPQQNSERIVVVSFNNPAALEAAFARYGFETAALILEPINYDSGCIRPQPGFLELCRDLCDRYEALLFFDEVLTAFRMCAGGAQTYLGVVPDLCVLGKAIGAGLPISAITGRRHVMQALRPLGPSEHSGTYLAHLTTILAALAALEAYSQPGFYDRLNAIGERFYRGLKAVIRQSGVPVRLQHVGPRFALYFGLPDAEVANYRQAACQDHELMRVFIRACIDGGVYFHISPHHGFSAAHTEADLDRALTAIEYALSVVREVMATRQASPQ